MKKLLPFFISMCFCVFLIPKLFAENEATEFIKIEFKINDEVLLTVQDIAFAELNTVYLRDHIANYMPELTDTMEGVFNIKLNLTAEGQKKLLNISKIYIGKEPMVLFIDGKCRKKYLPIEIKYIKSITFIFIEMVPEKEAQSIVNRINNKN